MAAKCKHVKRRRSIVREGWTKMLCTKCGHWYIKTITGRIIDMKDD